MMLMFLCIHSEAHNGCAVAFEYGSTWSWVNCEEVHILIIHVQNVMFENCFYLCQTKLKPLLNTNKQRHFSDKLRTMTSAITDYKKYFCTKKTLLRATNWLYVYLHDVLFFQMKCFLDFKPGGALCQIFSTMFRYKAEQRWRKFDFQVGKVCIPWVSAFHHHCYHSHCLRACLDCSPAYLCPLSIRLVIPSSPDNWLSFIEIFFILICPFRPPCCFHLCMIAHIWQDEYWILLTTIRILKWNCDFVPECYPFECGKLYCSVHFTILIL